MKQKKLVKLNTKGTFRNKKAEDSSGFLLWQVTSLWQREIRTLIQKGYVVRQEHSKDTRAKSVHLTVNGERLTKEDLKKVEGFDSDFFSALGVEKREFNLMLQSLLSKR